MKTMDLTLDEQNSVSGGTVDLSAAGFEEGQFVILNPFPDELANPVQAQRITFFTTNGNGDVDQIFV
ncbi:hypothetical protein [Kordiimonas sp. SCSIO 12610]|uniref:hypothetical protein n=1 Tax=Kordiimonas sp. SCSIO 12610 TaxID=2829597 RepID=UPI002109FFE6|nr:hypothetical protein [Kordiimonas sp. SCSIO 12610]UTW54520.1 hypothetical protein KFF44_11990 [Kordiimonas sp. SCSIO 12610]